MRQSGSRLEQVGDSPHWPLFCCRAHKCHLQSVEVVLCGNVDAGTASIGRKAGFPAEARKPELEGRLMLPAIVCGFCPSGNRRQPGTAMGRRVVELRAAGRVFINETA